MIFKLRTFKEFTNTELYRVLQLRSEVFVVEQNCAYQDMDGKDDEALHLVGFKESEIAAYARLLKPGMAYKEAAIGRVVVAQKYRVKKYGKELMNKAIAETIEKFGVTEIIVSAQKYLEKFYTDSGFVTESEVYLEDNIPHIKMRYIKK